MVKIVSLVVLVSLVACGIPFTDGIGDPLGDDDAGDERAQGITDDAPDTGAVDGDSDVATPTEASTPDASTADADAWDAEPVDTSAADAAPPDASTPDSSPPDAGLCCNTERCGIGGDMFVCGSSQHVCQMGCSIGDFCAYLGIASTVTPCP
jgi:hypothetical protein